MKRWKIFGAAGLLAVGLWGCQFTPKAAPVATALSSHGQIAQAVIPADQMAYTDVEGGNDASSLPRPASTFVAPKTEQQKLAEAPAQKLPGGKRKKARNGAMGEYKRDYTELMKKPELLGFHPREEQFEKILDTIRNSFVESAKDDRLQGGVRKEIKLFLDESNLDRLQTAVTKELAAFPGEAKDDKLQGQLRKQYRLFLDHGDPDKMQAAIAKDLSAYTVRTKDEKLPSAIQKQLKVFGDQAKVDARELTKLDAVALDQIFTKVQEVFGTRINKDLLGYVSMMGVLESLKDPYTVLMTPSEASKLKEQLQSRSFGGIGIYIELDRDNGNQLTIFEPIEGTPAAKAGLESGDKIIKIDGKPTKGVSIEMAQSQIRGEIGSTVLLTVQRSTQKELLDIKVERGSIHVVSVSSRTFPGDVGYIRVRTFGAETAEELRKALTRMKEENAKGVILDLRNNGGGYIDAAVGVVGEFAPAKSLVVYTIDRDKRKRMYPSTRAGGIGVPLVVMINEFSASASEIAAGALRDLKIATLVGDHSFGKGSVQQLFPLDHSFPLRGEDSPQLKLTIARFYTPNGDVIDKQGIEPQVVVDMEPRYVGKIEHDVQLKKALELLGGKVASKP